MTPDDQAFSVAEALARMAEQEYFAAADIARAGYPDVILRPKFLADWADKLAAERRDIAFIYAWYAVQILEGWACRCRWPHYCPHDGASLIGWLVGRHEPRPYLKTYPMPGSFEVHHSWPATEPGARLIYWSDRKEEQWPPSPPQEPT